MPGRAMPERRAKSALRRQQEVPTNRLLRSHGNQIQTHEDDKETCEEEFELQESDHISNLHRPPRSSRCSAQPIDTLQSHMFERCEPGTTRANSRNVQTKGAQSPRDASSSLEADSEFPSDEDERDEQNSSSGEESEGRNFSRQNQKKRTRNPLSQSTKKIKVAIPKDKKRRLQKREVEEETDRETSPSFHYSCSREMNAKGYELRGRTTRATIEDATTDLGYMLRDRNMHKRRPMNVQALGDVTKEALFGSRSRDRRGFEGDDENQSPDKYSRKRHSENRDGEPQGQTHMLVEVDPQISFASIGGLEDQKQKLIETVILPFKHPLLYQGVKRPSGLLFTGLPGTGKTLMAKALVNECKRAGRDVKFFYVNTHEILDKYVGEAEKRLYAVFDSARENSPSIVFIDEIDGLTHSRTTSRAEQGTHTLVTAFLTAMNGIVDRGEVFVLGATNRPEDIDEGLRRPGRFDEEVCFPMPDTNTRLKILKIRTEGWINSPPIHTLEEIASQAHNFSGADLEYLCTQAHTHAIRRTHAHLYKTYGPKPNEESKASHNPDNDTSSGSSDSSALEAPLMSVCVLPGDFFTALSEMKPSLYRVNSVFVSTLPVEGRTVLKMAMEECLSVLRAHSFLPGKDHTLKPEQDEDLYGLTKWLPYTHTDALTHRFVDRLTSAQVRMPRLMLVGPPDSGQGELANMIFCEYESVPVFPIDMGSLERDPGSVTVEQALSVIVQNAQSSNTQAIVYLPNIMDWWDSASEKLRVCITSVLECLPPNAPVLILSTVVDKHTLVLELLEEMANPNPHPNRKHHQNPDKERERLKKFLRLLISGRALMEAAKSRLSRDANMTSGGVVRLSYPDEEARMQYFNSFLEHLQTLPDMLLRAHVQKRRLVRKSQAPVSLAEEVAVDETKTEENVEDDVEVLEDKCSVSHTDESGGYENHLKLLGDKFVRQGTHTVETTFIPKQVSIDTDSEDDDLATILKDHMRKMEREHTSTMSEIVRRVCKATAGLGLSVLRQVEDMFVHHARIYVRTLQFSELIDSLKQTATRVEQM